MRNFKIQCAILLVAVAALSARAENVHFAWDPNPPQESVTNYVLFERVSTNYAVVGQTSGTNYILTNVTPGIHIYAAKAQNAWGESLFSNEVTVEIMPVPTAPGNFKVQQIAGTNTVSVGFTNMPNEALVMTSEDLSQWRDWMAWNSLDSSAFPDSVMFNVQVEKPKTFWRVVPSAPPPSPVGVLAP
jgi:hypothetical protein